MSNSTKRSADESIKAWAQMLQQIYGKNDIETALICPELTYIKEERKNYYMDKELKAAGISKCLCDGKMDLEYLGPYGVNDPYDMLQFKIHCLDCYQYVVFSVFERHMICFKASIQYQFDIYNSNYKQTGFYSGKL